MELKICCDKLDPVLLINPKLFQTEIYYFYSAAVELSRSLVLFEGWRNNREFYVKEALLKFIHKIIL